MPIGTWGRIKRTQIGEKEWVAKARFRDYDGVTRLVERSGVTGPKAENALKEALLERARLVGDDITAETRLRVVAEEWFADEIQGAKAWNTERRYREVLDLMVLPGMGMLTLREATVARCDRFLQLTTTSHGPSAAKHAKTVLSGVLGLATRRGALQANPVRDVKAIRVTVPEVEALTLHQVQTLRIALYADEAAVSRDIPDGVSYMLGTSARIGEAMALRWPDLDLDAAVPTALIRATTIFKKGEGTIIQEHPKRSSSRRRIPLPAFVVTMLRQRAEDARHELLVFPSARGRVRDPNNFRKGWDSFKVSHDLEWVHPHVFRKTAAAIVEDPELAAGLLGHADSNVTKTHYLPRITLAPDVRDRLDRMGEKPTSTQQNRAIVTGIVQQRSGREGELWAGQSA